MLESQVTGKLLWERQVLLERPSVQRRLRFRREYELQRRLAATAPVWRKTLHQVGAGLITIGERLQAGATTATATHA